MMDESSKEAPDLVSFEDAEPLPARHGAPMHPEGQLKLFTAEPADDRFITRPPAFERTGDSSEGVSADEAYASPLRVEIPAETPDLIERAKVWDRSVDLTTDPMPSQGMLSPATVQRTPNFVDAFLFAILLVLGFLVTTGALGVSLHYHLFGLRSFAEAKDDTRLALITQLSIYVIGLIGAVPFFQMVWGKGFFDGLHWHGATARRLLKRLLFTALACNAVAMVGNYVLPFPQHAPIDKMFSSPADAWMLFCFGVTIAPFFEEMIFRGFLLPAMATAWDWCAEKITHTAPRELDAQGNPVWSRAAMIFGALAVSAPFALMHSAQVGAAWGPISLLYCVSLILCSVRLMTRSLAASTVVHSAYNFMLFAVMLIQTDGFRHLDKM